MATNMGAIRHKIMKKRKAHFAPRTRKVITQDEVKTYYRKTILMKHLELKHNKPIDKIIWEGTIDHVAAKYGLDRSTVCKWRARLQHDKEEYNTSKFFSRFEEQCL